MEALTYPYGETPEKLIHEQFDLSKDQYGIVHVRDGYRNRLQFSNPLDLLTVLDALKRDSWMIVNGRAGRKPQDTEPGKLYLSILAALGIEES